MSVYEDLERAQTEIRQLRSALAVTGADFIAATREWNAALATIERVRALIPKWLSDRATYPLDDVRAPMAFLAVKACEKELAEALEATS